MATIDVLTSFQVRDKINNSLSGSIKGERY